jgi:hypothetical protein
MSVTLDLPDAVLDEIARRAAELISPVGDTPRPWLDTKAAAGHLCCPVSRIHDLVQLGKLQPCRDGRRLLFRATDLDSYLEGV